MGSLSNYLLSLVLGERATLFPQKIFTADQRKGHRIQSFEGKAILLRMVSASVYLSAPINLRRFELFKREFCRIFLGSLRFDMFFRKLKLKRFNFIERFERL